MEAAIARAQTSSTPPSSPVQVIDLADSPGRVYYRLDSIQNVIFFSSKPVTYERLQSDGGHDVNAIGLEIAPSGPKTTAALYFYNINGAATVTGVHIDNALAGERDGIAVASAPGQRTDVVVEHTVVENISGTYTGVHGDVFQSYGALGRITIRGFWGSTNYQGVFLSSGPGDAPTSVELSNVALSLIPGAHPSPTLLWIGTRGEAPYPVVLDNVFIDGAVSSRSAYATIVYNGLEQIQPTRRGSQISWEGSQVVGGVT